MATNDPVAAAAQPSVDAESVRRLVREELDWLRGRPEPPPFDARQAQVLLSYAAFRNALGSHALQGVEIVQTLIAPPPVIIDDLLEFESDLNPDAAQVALYAEDGHLLGRASLSDDIRLDDPDAVRWVEILDGWERPVQLGVPVHYVSVP